METTNTTETPEQLPVHCPQRIEGTKKRCCHCWKNGSNANKMTEHYCSECEVHLCIGQCFDNYHSNLENAHSTTSLPAGEDILADKLSKTSCDASSDKTSDNLTEMASNVITDDPEVSIPSVPEDINEDSKVNDATASHEQSKSEDNTNDNNANLVKGPKNFKWNHSCVSQNW